MELKKNILSELSQPRPRIQTWYILTHKWILDIKQRVTSLYSMSREKLGKKENPKRDIHGSPWEREIISFFNQTISPSLVFTGNRWHGFLGLDGVERRGWDKKEEAESMGKTVNGGTTQGFGNRRPLSQGDLHCCLFLLLLRLWAHYQHT